MSVGSGIAMGMVTGMMIGQALEEDEPINWKCSTCRHSYTKHRSGFCEAGVFNKCGCNRFQLDENEVKQAQDEIEQVRKTLFKYYDEARELEAQ